MTAKAKRNQAAMRVSKSFSMGAFSGPGRSSSSTMARTKQAQAAAMRGQKRRRAAGAFHCRPAKNLLCQKRGKMSREAARVMRYSTAMLPSA